MKDALKIALKFWVEDLLYNFKNLSIIVLLHITINYHLLGIQWEGLLSEPLSVILKISVRTYIPIYLLALPILDIYMNLQHIFKQDFGL